MNENISWGKIAVLVVAMASVGVLGFVAGRNAELSRDTVAMPDMSNDPEKSVGGKNKNTLTLSGRYVKGPESFEEWNLGPHTTATYFQVDKEASLPAEADQVNGSFFFQGDEADIERAFGLSETIIDDGRGQICGFSGRATIEVSEYVTNKNGLPISNDSADLVRVISMDPYTKNCFLYAEK